MISKITKLTTTLAVLMASFFIHSNAIAQQAFVQVEHSGNVICGVADNNSVVCNSAFNVSARTPDNLPPVKQIAAGGGTVCAVLVSGDLQCFGSLPFGLDAWPTQGAPYQSVSMSANHACAINSSNSIECWGLNSNNRLEAPVGEFSQLSLARQQACAVDLNGGVSCWGSNDQGTTDVPADLPAATKVVAGFASSCALLTDGSIQCWGRNINALPGPYVDFDLNAGGSLQTGRSGICATDAQGRVNCTRYIYGSDPSGAPSDSLTLPVVGITDVSMAGSQLGCYINAGEIDCFGTPTSTEPPSLSDMVSVPATTGLTALAYSRTTLELFWDAPRDAFNVGGHEISRNGEVIAFTQNLSSFLITDFADETQDYAVRRISVNGDPGPFSDAIAIAPFNGTPDSIVTPINYERPERQFEESFLDAFVFCADFAELFWFSDTPTPDIDGYEIHRDGEFIAFTDQDFYDDEGITTGVRHNYDVIAIDLDNPTRFHGVASMLLEIDDAESCE